MAEYTFYAQPRHGGPPVRDVIVAPSDAAARRIASETYAAAAWVEVWCGPRLVLRLDRSGG